MLQEIIEVIKEYFFLLAIGITNIILTAKGHKTKEEKEKKKIEKICKKAENQTKKLEKTREIIEKLEKEKK